VCRLAVFALCALVGLAGAPSCASASQEAPEPSTLRMGVYPSISTIALLRRFAPLRDYLTRQLGREVVLETAGDIDTFQRRTAQRRYDLVLTAPHFALAALDSGRYRVQVTPTNPLSAQVVVAAAGDIHHFSQLAGARVGTPPPDALISLIGRDLLVRRGLTGPRAPTFQPFETHNAAYKAVLGGDVRAAVISVNIYRRARLEGQPLRSVAHSRDFPGVGILTAADLPAALQARIRRVLVGMSASPGGREALRRVGHPGYRRVAEGEYEVLRPYLRAARHLEGRGSSGDG